MKEKLPSALSGSFLAKSFLANAGASLASRVVGRGLGLLTSIVIARRLQPASFGVYSTALAATFVFSVVSDFGLRHLLVRELTKRPEDEGSLLTASIIARLPLAVFGMVLLGIFLHIMQYPATISLAALIIAAGYFFDSISSSIFASFQARGRLAWETAAIGISRFGSLILVWIWVRQPGHILPAVAAFTAQSLFQMALSVAFARRQGLSASKSKDLILLLRGSVPFFVTFLAAGVYFKADILFLERWWGTAVAGKYTAAYNVVLIGLMVSNSLSAAAYPLLSKEQGVGSKALPVARLVFAYGGAAAIISAIALPEMVRILYGSQYLLPKSTLLMLALAVAPDYLNPFVGHILFAEKRESWQARVLTIAAVANLALNFFLIPRWGPLGAAVATGVSLLLVLIWTGLKTVSPVVRSLLARTTINTTLGLFAGLMALKAGYPLAILLSLGSYLLLTTRIFAVMKFDDLKGFVWKGSSDV